MQQNQKQEKLKLEFEGKIFSSNAHGEFEVVEYIMSKNIKIRFLKTGTEKTVTKQHIEKKKIRDDMYPVICGVGFIGSGVHRAVENYKTNHIYNTWVSMLHRCYNEVAQKSYYPSYVGCSVDQIWYNYQTFAKWYIDNTINAKQKYQLDKDLLIKGNRIYSPHTCVLLPHRLNGILVNNNSSRGKYMVGVRKTNNIYTSGVNGCYPVAKCFKTEEEAFVDYKTRKEALIKQKADEFKNEISLRAYFALMEYKIDRND